MLLSRQFKLFLLIAFGLFPFALWLGVKEKTSSCKTGRNVFYEVCDPKNALGYWLHERYHLSEKSCGPVRDLVAELKRGPVALLKGKSFLLIGDSQEQRLVQTVCEIIGAELQHWPEGGEGWIIQSTGKRARKKLNHLCTKHNFTVANFFHFGVIKNLTYYNDAQATGNHHTRTNERITFDLPRISETLGHRNFDMIVIAGTSWDGAVLFREGLALAKIENVLSPLQKMLTKGRSSPIVDSYMVNKTAVWLDGVHDVVKSVKELFPNTKQVYWRSASPSNLASMYEFHLIQMMNHALRTRLKMGFVPGIEYYDFYGITAELFYDWADYVHFKAHIYEQIMNLYFHTFHLHLQKQNEGIIV